METELICNYKKCRNKIKDCAWVTSCSHVFCNADGTREFHKSLLCPACDTNLPGKYDIIRMDLNPSEQYKSIILAGLSPDIILDICSRAMSFWVYQMQQELRWQSRNASSLGERYDRLEQAYEQYAAKSKAETQSLKKDLEASKQEIESHKKRSSELMEKLAEKNRQMQKIQTMYENLRRKCISPVYFERDVPPKQQGRRDLQCFDVPLTTVEEIIGHSRVSSLSKLQSTFVQVQDPSTGNDFRFLPENLSRSSQCLPPNSQHTLSPMESQFSVHLKTPKGV